MANNAVNVRLKRSRSMASENKAANGGIGFFSECKRLDEELKEKKVKLADKMVDSVVSKIL